MRKEYFNLISEFLKDINNRKANFTQIDILRGYIIEELSKSQFFEKEFLYVFFMVANLNKNPEKSEAISNLIFNLKNLYDQYPRDSYESFIINDNIFLLNILNGKLIEGFGTYLKELIQKDFNLAISKDYRGFWEKFCGFLLKHVDKDLIFNTLKEIITKDFLINLKKRRRRTVINWVWNCLWGSGAFLKRTEECNWFYPIFKEVLYGLIEKKKVDEVLHFSMFIANSFVEWKSDIQKTFKMFQNEITEPSEKLYKEYLNKNRLLPCKKEVNKKGKIKIAIVRPNIGYWSPFIVEYSFVKNLISNKEFNKKYEISFYSMDFFELWNTGGDDKKCLDFIKKTGINYKSPVSEFRKYGYYYSHLQKILKFREKLIEDGIDIILYPDHHSCGEFLFLSRCAPKQIYWSHGNDFYNVDNIDKRVHHSPGSIKYKKFDFEYMPVQIDQDTFYNPPVNFEEVKKIRMKFPENAFILGSIGRLTKINDKRYLSAIAEIMQRCPDTIYLACGNGDTTEIRQQIKKLGMEKRFYFEGFVDSHVYGHIIDLMLDSFPMRGGESVREFMSKGKFAVVYNQLKPYYCIDSLLHWIEDNANIGKYFPYLFERNKKDAIRKLDNIRHIQNDYISQRLTNGKLKKFNGKKLTEFLQSILYDFQYICKYKDEKEYIEFSVAYIKNEKFRNSINSISRTMFDSSVKFFQKEFKIFMKEILSE